MLRGNGSLNSAEVSAGPYQANKVGGLGTDIVHYNEGRT